MLLLVQKSHIGITTSELLGYISPPDELFGHVRITTGYKGNATTDEFIRYETAQLVTRRSLRYNNGMTLPGCKLIVTGNVTDDCVPYFTREGDYVRSRYLWKQWKPADLQHLVPAPWFSKADLMTRHQGPAAAEYISGWDGTVR